MTVIIWQCLGFKALCSFVLQLLFKVQFAGNYVQYIPPYAYIHMYISQRGHKTYLEIKH